LEVVVAIGVFLTYIRLMALVPSMVQREKGKKKCSNLWHL
jgi:hypothetical protein